MIEEFFEHPYTLRYLRDGVTAPHIDDFAVTLVEQGFKRGWARSLLRGVAHLGHWLDRRSLTLAELDEEVLKDFRKHLSRCRCVRGNKGRLEYCRSGSRRFLSWARAQGLAPAALCESVPPLIQSFEKWMLEHRKVASSTLGNYRLQLRRFLDAAGDDPVRYNATSIRDFILVQSQRTGPSRAKSAVTAVRMLLRYLSLTGQCAPELIDAVPTIAHWKLGPLPRYLSTEVIDQMVESCDQTTASGRRDRAVLLLITRLGLRAGDVAALRLGDIDWSTATIMVSGKSRRETRLPLPQDVGDAILAWLAEGRPVQDDSHVFVTARAPVGSLHPRSVGGIAARAAERVAKRTGAIIPRVGAHVLRHSAATSLLREGMSLSAIGALLRHRSLETTTIYAKVDVDLLGTIARPWPEEVSP